MPDASDISDWRNSEIHDRLLSSRSPDAALLEQESLEMTMLGWEEVRVDTHREEYVGTE